MPFNRIGGFYLGRLGPLEEKPMSKEKPMSDEKPKSIDEANASLNQELNPTLDKLSYVLETHEKGLRAMQLVRDVHYAYARWYPDEQRPDICEERLIGIKRWNGNWRLCHGTFVEHPAGGESDWKPLADSRVEDRLRAIPQITKLREAVIEDKKKLIPQLEEVYASAVKALEDYSNGDGLLQLVRTMETKKPTEQKIPSAKTLKLLQDAKKKREEREKGANP